MFFVCIKVVEGFVTNQCRIFKIIFQSFQQGIIRFISLADVVKIFGYISVAPVVSNFDVKEWFEVINFHTICLTVFINTINSDDKVFLFKTGNIEIYTPKRNARIFVI